MYVEQSIFIYFRNLAAGPWINRRLNHSIAEFERLQALHSPDGVAETGLGVWPPEKNVRKLACGTPRDTFSSAVWRRDLQNCGHSQRFFSVMQPVFSKGQNVWRRGRDSNPRYPLRYVRFRGGSFQPLTHLSGKRSLVVGPGSLAPIHTVNSGSRHSGLANDQRPRTNDRPYRRLRKKVCSTSPQRPASTPVRTSIRWFKLG